MLAYNIWQRAATRFTRTTAADADEDEDEDDGQLRCRQASKTSADIV